MKKDIFIQCTMEDLIEQPVQKENKVNINGISKKIYNFIKLNGGFEGFKSWTKNEIAEWIYTYFDCTKSVAVLIAQEIK